MTQVGFYHLLRTTPDEALPALLGRTLAAGERALVVCASAERVAALDNSLWLATEPDWLPHGTAATGHAELQPIWIGTEDTAPNGAAFLFLLDGVVSGRLAEYRRVFDLFDGRDVAAVAAARLRWTAAKQAGHDLTYWAQGPRGWEKKA
jgi:DNA polymerase-3 subunit chi